MVQERYAHVPAEHWAKMGPAWRGVDANFAAIESAGGGGGVRPRTTLLNVQSPDGSWLINAASVAAARAAGYAVYWVTDATAVKAPKSADGLADNDVVNGETWLTMAAPDMADDFGTTSLTQAAFVGRVTPTGSVPVTVAGTGAVTVDANGRLTADATAGNIGIDWAIEAGVGATVALDVYSLTGAECRVDLRTQDTTARVSSRVTTTGFAPFIMQGTLPYDGNMVTSTGPGVYSATYRYLSGEHVVTTKKTGVGDVAVVRRTSAAIGGNTKLRLFVPVGSVAKINSIALYKAA